MNADATTESAGTPDLLMPQALLSRTAERLAAHYRGIVSEQTVERVVFESYTALRRTSRIHTHLVTLTGRFAAERLAALAQSTGATTKTVPEVLFICVHNAGRSQMAAALLTHHAAGRVHVRSAGSLPAAENNPIVERAMTEIGLDLAAEFPKPLTDDVVAAADVVISMGCGDACPIFPGKRYEDWQLDDPAGRGVEAVRPIRDEIRGRVQELLASLGMDA